MCFITRLALIFLLPVGVFGLAGSAFSQEAGFVSGVSGGARVSDLSKAPARLIRSGEIIRAGDVIETDANAHVYIVTLDQGFLSVRPNSRFVIEAYNYDPAKPSQTEIRFTLERGVVRVVSGKGLASMRERFRLNTPVAAIGVRGTDFSVFTDARDTFASVALGRIAVSPLNQVCVARALGPCTGDSVLDLLAGDLPVLKVSQGDLRPVLVNEIQLSPERISPPRSEERPNEKAAVPASAPLRDQAAATSLGDATLSPSRSQLELQISSALVPPVPESKIFWGRWADIAAGDPQSVEAIFGQSRQLIASVGPYAMSRERASLSLPQSGVVSFSLQQSEAFLVNQRSGAMTSLLVLNPMLRIDFSTNRFVTQLDLTSPVGVIELRSQGAVTQDGRLLSDLIGADATVRGVLAGVNAEQAGYLFQKQIPGTGDAAVGLTRWVR